MSVRHPTFPVATPPSSFRFAKTPFLRLAALRFAKSVQLSSFGANKTRNNSFRFPVRFVIFSPSALHTGFIS
jgi:hypothetical protein